MADHVIEIAMEEPGSTDDINPRYRYSNKTHKSTYIYVV